MVSATFVSIVGTRPQFLKLAPLSLALQSFQNIKHIIIHSGQHYDSHLSSALFATLNIPAPNHLLTPPSSISDNAQQSPHGSAVGHMLIQLEPLLANINPNLVLVYGDCNTTLAGAICASKLQLTLVHIESGLRSYNRSMPEEINRVVVDHLANILCCPSCNAFDNLNREGILNPIYVTGNLQIDLLKTTITSYHDDSILTHNNLKKSQFILLTIHRQRNTNKSTLQTIFDQLALIPQRIFFPIHPRTEKIVVTNNIIVPDNIVLHTPVNYLNMTILERFASLIITDSGGIQIEAHYLHKPCFTVRPDTEWHHTLKNGQNTLVEPHLIYQHYRCLNSFNLDYALEHSYTLNCSQKIINNLLFHI